MLPLPPELYCSPATNPTLDSSDSEETPLRSLQEPAAPKMVTANAKRYDLYSIPRRKTSFVKMIPRRSQIATSFPPAWFATQASKPRSRLLWRNRRRPKYVACVNVSCSTQEPGNKATCSRDHLSSLVQFFGHFFHLYLLTAPQECRLKSSNKVCKMLTR